MIVKEALIYQKIKDNQAPYWVLYSMHGPVKATTPLDVFVANEDMPPDRLIEHSINRLQQTLQLYKDNTINTELPQFAITLKASPKSHGDKVFEYIFQIDTPTDNQPLQGTPTPTQPPMMDSLMEIMEKKVALAGKETYLSMWEKQLTEREKNIKARERELEKDFEPYRKMLNMAMPKLVESAADLFGNAESGLSGTDHAGDPKAQTVEDLATYIYENFDEAQIGAIKTFVEQYYKKLYEHAISKNTETTHNTDTATETGHNEEDSRQADR